MLQYRAMQHLALFGTAILTGVLLGGCGSPETAARAESVAQNEFIAKPSEPPPAAAVKPAEDAKSPEPLPATAQPDKLDLLKQQLEKIAAEPARKPSPTETTFTPVPRPDSSGSSTVDDDVRALQREVQELRGEVDRLQETVDAALAYLVGALGDENRRLKKDLALVNENESEGGMPPTGAEEEAPPAPVPPAVRKVNYGKEGYLSVKEWGRTPEQAKELGGNVSSLRGMICAVAPGATDEELKAIGKKLRAQCAGYDNVNIDVFDDEAAARDYSDRNVRSSEHYVMNITRHKASGRDVIVLIHGNGSREVVVE